MFSLLLSQSAVAQTMEKNFYVSIARVEICRDGGGRVTRCVLDPRGRPGNLAGGVFIIQAPLIGYFVAV